MIFQVNTIDCKAYTSPFGICSSFATINCVVLTNFIKLFNLFSLGLNFVIRIRLIFSQFLHANQVETYCSD